MKKRLALVLAVVLLLACVPSASAAGLYFTGINDSVAPLTSGTMPCWVGGTLYVPYDVFDANQNGVGVSLGLYTSYSRDTRTVAIFNLRQTLTFDLDRGTCQDSTTGAVYSSRAIMRSGKPYVSVAMVCSVFDMEYSYSQLPYIPQGYLVRIRNADAVKDDADFIDAARSLINNRLRDYTQGLSSAETTSPAAPSAPTLPANPDQPDESGVAVCLALRCESAGGLEATLDALDGAGRYALFFLTPQLIEEEGSLVRRALGTGHSVGIWAEDGSEETLDRGRRALEERTCTRTALADVPAGERPGLEERGWVCWEETLLLSAGPEDRANSFASAAVNRLENRRTDAFLTLEGEEDAARVLPALLSQLEDSHCTVALPLETRL